MAMGQTAKPEFDAASVKPSGEFVPGVLPVMSGGPGTNDPGRITSTRRTLLGLVAQAWDLKPDQISGPAWLKEFHMQIHHETRDFPGYELQISDKGPKLKETVHGDEEATPGPLVPRKGPDGSVKLRPGPQSVTMSNSNVISAYYQAKPISDLVRQLGGFVNSSTGAKDGSPSPRIVDKTGLTAKYDFALEFDCQSRAGIAAIFRNLPAFAGRGGDTPAPQEPDPGSGLPNIFVAIEKQLGLKLVKVKDVPTDILVIDRADKTPEEN
jgi:uncharacterized protein (TIGR03435 family)